MKQFIIAAALFLSACQGENMSKENNLTNEEYQVISLKGTERAGTGFYNHFEKDGTYTCRQCDNPLFTSDTKFDSHCGWPSFDDAITGAVIEKKDGNRTEIVCAKCGGHLGHVFKGEGMTDKNLRHCVNSLSLDFTATTPSSIDTAYFAGGCFWGVEYYFEKVDGVIDAVSGYMGGKSANPSYKEVSTGISGHIETVAVTYNPTITSFKELAQLFFEIHDPTQANGQGPDIGSQYLSAIFVHNTQEKSEAEDLINQLTAKGYKITTTLYETSETPFYSAEGYHQDYYSRRNKVPYCHTKEVRFQREVELESTPTLETPQFILSV